MRLLHVNSGEFETFEGDSIPPYAILSHRWEEGKDGEITFEDMQRGGERLRDFKGYRKLMFSCSQAARERDTIFRGKVITKTLSWLWIDTFCIKKSDSSELSESINSMYKWYKEAAICYAFLPDVKNGNMQMFEESEWFRRGWTLQELLAPRDVVFYDYDWGRIGKRSELSDIISRITNIPATALISLQFKPRDYSVADKMSWAAKRKTGKLEDRAYSLLGLFEVNMPLIYGEGTRAFYRLQEEILKVSTDLTIFAWDRGPYEELGALAATPDSFDHGSKCYRSVNFKSNRFSHNLQSGDWITDDQGTSLSNVGLTASLNLVPWSRLVYLAPVCDIYETIDHYVHQQEPQLTVGMMLDRRESGHFQRVSDEEQALFEIPAKVTQMKTQRVTICRQEMQYLREEGGATTVIYNGIPPGPDTNGFQLISIHPVCSKLMQTSDERESMYILSSEARMGHDPSTSDQYISIFSRTKTGGQGVMTVSHGTIGIVGYICFAHPDYRRTVLYFGYGFDYKPYCLLMRPHESSMSPEILYVYPVTKVNYWMNRIRDIEDLVRDIQVSGRIFSWSKNEIELRFASGTDMKMEVRLSSNVRVSFFNVGSARPLQVVLEPDLAESDMRDMHERIEEEFIEHEVAWSNVS